MKRFTDFVLLNLGLLFVASGIHFFKVPNSFATGGVSGVAIILDHYIPSLSVGPLMLIINTILLVLGFIMLGKEFIGKTIYSGMALSGMVWLLDALIPLSGPLTADTTLELVYAIMLPAVGSAIVFNLDASTGGTDIIAKVLNKYTSIDIGKALLASDFVITVCAGLTYGIRIGMYSVMGLILKGFLIDMVIEGFNTKKQVVIVSEKPEEIREYIIKNIHRGATIHEARGAYTGEIKHVITSVMGRKQALDLRNFIRKIDRDAFITITNSSEIIGKGFRSI
jgi:uncharacterized membrane-anchored protein YitT (DUF2179 family)